MGCHPHDRKTRAGTTPFGISDHKYTRDGELRETPLLEISVKAAAIEALGWNEYDRLPHRWIVKYEKAVAHADRPPVDELQDVMGDYWVDPSDMPVADLVTTEEVE